MAERGRGRSRVAGGVARPFVDTAVSGSFLCQSYCKYMIIAPAARAEIDR